MKKLLFLFLVAHMASAAQAAEQIAQNDFKNQQTTELYFEIDIDEFDLWLEHAHLSGEWDSDIPFKREWKGIFAPLITQKELVKYAQRLKKEILSSQTWNYRWHNCIDTYPCIEKTDFNRVYKFIIHRQDSIRPALFEEPSQTISHSEDVSFDPKTIKKIFAENPYIIRIHTLKEFEKRKDELEFEHNFPA